MNYYILPKNNITIDIDCKKIEHELCSPYVSKSLFNSLNIMQQQLNIYDDTIVTEMKQILNTYEFVSTNVPQTNLSVSKVKPESHIFYELMEIFYTLNICEIIKNKPKITSSHFSPNYTSSSYLFNLMREEYDDNYVIHDFNTKKIINYVSSNNIEKNDILFFEFKKEDYQNLYDYFNNLVIVLYVILKTQNSNGISIIKIDNIFYKLIVDILYVLSGIYDKVYIIKPSVSNIMNNERYIICKNFISKNHNYLEDKIYEIIQNMNINETHLLIDINSHFVINSFIGNSMPYYFINKIEESNIVIGQQQLENYILMINIIKNKNKEEKLEPIKRTNIQKCIQWCERYKIPHNKFMDKTNIFLNDRMMSRINYDLEDQHDEQNKEQSEIIVNNIYDFENDNDNEIIDYETDNMVLEMNEL